VARTRRTFTLEDEAHAVLDRLGNYSDYVNKLVLQHGRDWTEALAMLVEHGWQSAEILAACDALRGYGFANAGRDGRFLAEQLERVQELEGCFTKREVSTQRRQRCLKQLVDDHAVAHALATLVREYSVPNEACQQAIRQVRSRK
jgi:hypothetical protein